MNLLGILGAHNSGPAIQVLCTYSGRCLPPFHGDCRDEMLAKYPNIIFCKIWRANVLQYYCKNRCREWGAYSWAHTATHILQSKQLYFCSCVSFMICFGAAGHRVPAFHGINFWSCSICSCIEFACVVRDKGRGEPEDKRGAGRRPSSRDLSPWGGKAARCGARLNPKVCMCLLAR